MVKQTLDRAFQHIRKLAAVQTRRGLADCELLRQFVEARDEAAFTVLVERHGPMILGVCRRALRHAQDAEDACQATFLVLARRAASVRKAASVSSWLHGVACRVAANLKREHSRRCRREREVRPSAPPDPPGEVSWREVQAALDEELQGLPERLRAPLILCYLEGRTRDEAARRLNLTAACLHGRLERGRKRLCDRLTRRGLTLSATFLAAALGEGVARAVPSPTTVLSAARAAALLSGGQPAAGGVIPARVLTLTQEVLKGMFLTKLKLGMSAAACAGLLLAAIGGSLAAVGTSQEAKPPAPADKGTPVVQADAGASLDADGRTLPAGAVRRLGSRRFRVEGRSQFALPTPDGKHVLVQPQPDLSAYAAQGLMLFDAESGLRVRTFEDSRRVPKVGYYDAIRPAAFSPDGSKLYAIATHKSEEGGEAFDVWANLDNPCKRVLLVWDVATGKRVAEWELPAAGLQWEWPPAGILRPSMLGVTVSQDGKRVFVYGAVRMRTNPDRHVVGVPGVHVLDAATGKKLQTWEGAGYPVGMIAGGKEVVTYRRAAAITARDAETGKEVRTYPVQGTVPDVTVSPDGKTVAAVVAPREKDEAMAGEVILWEADTGREVRRLSAGTKTVRFSMARVVFAADGKTLYLAGNGRILRWDLSDGHELPGWPAHNGSVAELFRRPGTNELVSVGASDGVLRRWDAATGKALSTTDAYVGELAVARTPDGKGVVAVDAAGRLDVWDVAAGRITKTLQTPGRTHHELLFTPDGKQLLLAAQTGPNTVWDLAAGKQVGEFAPPPKKDPKADEYWWDTLAFSPDGRRLAASKHGRGTWMWAWPERTVLWHEAKEQGCYFAPDGETVLCADWHGEIQARDSRTGAVQRTLPGTGLTHAAFSPDRRRLVTAHVPGGRGRITSQPEGPWCVRDAATGAVLKEVKAFHYPWSVAFSPTGWLLAVAGDNAVRVYDTATWAEVARFEGHEGTVRTVFFGPDDATLISASHEDGTALVWSLKPPAGREPPDPAKLWSDLAGDGPAVRQAVWAAAQHPEAALKLFREKWPIPKDPLDPKQVARLLADLDSPEFATREAATAELGKLGRRVEAELRKALAETASPEVRRRAEKVLALWAPSEAAEYSAEDARELRAVWALELAGTAAARTLLEEWAAAKVGNRLCEEAARAVRRLRQKK
jgi:RNA polymerase sigma factor (sigma-70 family)